MKKYKVQQISDSGEWRDISGLTKFRPAFRLWQTGRSGELRIIRVKIS